MKGRMFESGPPILGHKKAQTLLFGLFCFYLYIEASLLDLFEREAATATTHTWW